MSKLDIIAFDADDTLWHNLVHFDNAEAEFGRLMAGYTGEAEARNEVVETESRNVKLYGYGVKSFTLSMIEAAIKVSDGAVDSATIAKLLRMGRAMLDHDLELLPHVEETLTAFHGEFKLLLITKGDLHHQERKVLASGLAHLFDGVEIVSDKRRETYEKICVRHGGDVTRTLMAGNSLRSDVMPMINAGGYGVYVPFAIAWAHEHEEVPAGTERFFEVPDIRGVAEVVRKIG